MSRPLLLVATGDVPAHRVAAVASGAELLAEVGPLPARVVVEDVLAEPSWDVSTATQFALARRVRAALAEDEFAGVVVVHGLDTLEETAFLADLVAGAAAARGAIVFTGGARSLADPEPDCPRNLADSLAAAADPALRGVGAVVCAAGELHAARRATLLGSAFTSAPEAPLGRVRDGRLRLVSAPPSRPPAAAGPPESDIALVRAYPDMPTSVLTAVTDAGARGVVLEGTGAGNVPVELFGAVAELVGMDIPVVVASGARSSGIGLVGRMGAIGANGLAAGKARMALMVALSEGGGVAAARAWFAADATGSG
ncbi:asparaginase domain-containing protein [Actinophytocola xanthii]|uniref:L-asparaginase n=1 Tax=Actinophytocola xanthii TaxID=1912961 RepID=A0A1Q8C3Q1_9PSEU|nr:asparaginase domain-containing protein [Actinophytocola xanthii]OLF08976.1 L-asparaginase [Actinophytocola xanthii]